MTNWFFQQHIYGEYAFSWWGLALVLGIVLIITLFSIYVSKKYSIKEGDY